MIRQQRFVLYLVSTFAWLIAQPSHSTLLQLNTELSQNFSAGSMGLSNFYETEDRKAYFSNWFLNLSTNRTLIEDDTSEEIEIRGRDISVGGGWNFFTNYQLNISAFQSQTPETEFNQGGGELDLSYSNFDTKIPFGIGVGFGKSTINQSFEFVILNRLIRRDAELEQDQIKLFLTVSPLYWLFLKINYKSYEF